MVRIVVIIPKVYLMPEAKPRDTNVPMVLLLLVTDSPNLLVTKTKLKNSNNLPRVVLLLVNDFPNLLVPKEKLRNTNNISYYHFYSANMPNHLLIIIIVK